MKRNNSFVLGATRYRVIGPVVVARDTGGGESYISQGGFLPASTSPAHIEHLLSLKLIEPMEATK